MSAEHHEIEWDKHGHRGTSRRADGKQMTWHRLSSAPAQVTDTASPAPDGHESHDPTPPAAE